MKPGLSAITIISYLINHLLPASDHREGDEESRQESRGDQTGEQRRGEKSYHCSINQIAPLHLQVDTMFDYVYETS